MEQNFFFKSISKLVFTQAIKHIKYFRGTTQVYSWKYNEMSEEIIENITKSNSNLAMFISRHKV